MCTQHRCSLMPQMQIVQSKSIKNKLTTHTHTNQHTQIYDEHILTNLSTDQSKSTEKAWSGFSNKLIENVRFFFYWKSLIYLSIPINVFMVLMQISVSYGLCCYCHCYQFVLISFGRFNNDFILWHFVITWAQRGKQRDREKE